MLISELLQFYFLYISSPKKKDLNKNIDFILERLYLSYNRSFKCKIKVINSFLKLYFISVKNSFLRTFHK